jgi:hypothetical protein
VNEIAYGMLKEQPGLRSAPYLASGGMKWIQDFAKLGLSDDGLRESSPRFLASSTFAIRESHFIVGQGLSKKNGSRWGSSTRSRARPRCIVDCRTPLQIA